MRINKNQGITLIALAITIAVLLILAGVSIATLTGENRIIEQTNKAKIRTEIENEKETLQLAVLNASNKDKWGEITSESISKELDKQMKEKYEIGNEEGIIITYKDSKRSYIINSNGKVEQYIKKIVEPEPEKSDTTKTIETSYGVIEIEFLNKKGYSIGEANEPILKDGMKAVYWAKDESGELDTENYSNNKYEITSDNPNFKKENWYQYTAQTNNIDGKTSRWANAITEDGSYYVWIPRYCYRIIYFNTENDENAYRAGNISEQTAIETGAIIGYSDARGIVDKNGERPQEVNSKTAISTNEKYFRTHPAFDGNINEGGWDKKLEGIWVMKYEASRNDASEGSRGQGTIPKSVPNVRSWTDKTTINENFNYVKNAYNNGDVQNTTLNSHIIKNSEWGAVTYLTESKYGRNGTRVSVNQCTVIITGAGRGIGENQFINAQYANLPDESQKYNGEIGVLSSTTGNIYGIYDMSGGAYEYVMGFYGETENSPSLGNTGFDSSNIPDRKYYDLYINKTNTDGEELGSALFETKKWYNTFYGYVYTSEPIFLRGGHFSASSSGLFSYAADDGAPKWGYGFRACIAII